MAFDVNTDFFNRSMGAIIILRNLKIKRHHQKTKGAYP